MKIKSVKFDHEDGSNDLLGRAGHLNVASKDLTLDTEVDAETALKDTRFPCTSTPDDWKLPVSLPVSL